MKYVILSFDDGRLDNYTNAFPILKKNNLTATFNIISDFILHSDSYTCFGSACNKAMSVANLVECQNYGIEIALHGATHKNTVQDVLQNVKDLNDMGIDTDGVGFASPFSELTEKNCDAIYSLVEKGDISYMRTGIQTRRMGIKYVLLSAINRLLRCKTLFWFLNKSNVLQPSKFPKLMKGVSITKATTVNEVKFCVNKLKESEAIILIFHSILNKSDKGYNKDRWFWDADKLERLCSFLNENSDVSVITTKQLLSIDKSS